MSANTNLEVDDYTERAPSGIDWDELDGSKGGGPDRWLIQSLDELVPSGEFAGVSATALDAILAVADRIEHGRIADDARKPLADLIRCLAHVALARQVQAS